MGLWDVIHDAVKAPVTNAHSKIDEVGRAAASKLDEVGRAAASKIDEGVRFHGVIHDAVKAPVTNAHSKIDEVGRAAASKLDEVGRAAASKIDEGVRFHGDDVKLLVKDYLPGPEGRDKIVQVLTHPATKEAIKFVAPGGLQTAYTIVGSLLGKNQNQDDEEQNKYEHLMQQMKVLKDENEKIQKELKKLMIINNSSVLEQKPEEVTALINPDANG